MMNKRGFASALALALASAAGADALHAPAAVTEGSMPSASTQPLKPKRDPAAYFTEGELVNQDGEKLRFYSDVLKGRTVVLGTMYTHCEDACPLITEQLKKVSREMGDAFGKDIFFVAISSDPQRDTPAVLKQYAARHRTEGPGWIYLTGKKSEVDVILKKLGAWAEHIESHSTQLIVWNFTTDRGRKMLPNLPPEALAANIRLIAGSANLTVPEAVRAVQGKRD